RRIKSLREKWTEEAHSDGNQTQADRERGRAKRAARLLQFKFGRLTERGEITLETARLGSTDLSDDAKALSWALANTTLILEPSIGALDEAGALADCGPRPGLHINPEVVILRVCPDGRDSELL